MQERISRKFNLWINDYVINLVIKWEKVLFCGNYFH